MGEDKTFLQLAKEIGTSKQNVYRCFKRFPDEVRQEAIQCDGVTYLPESVQQLIKAEFASNSASGDVLHDTHHESVRSASSDTGIIEMIQVLREQLAEKDKQIEHLQTALAQEQAALAREQENVKLAQQLHGADKVQQALSAASDGADVASADGEAGEAPTGEAAGEAARREADGKRSKGFRWPWSRRD